MGKKRKLFIILIMFSLLAVLFCGFFYSVYTNTIDKSSYTDWISAFCNVVIAGATVGAVITARNYLAQFTAQEGYKIAISLFNDNLLLLVKQDHVIHDYEKLYTRIISFDNKRTTYHMPKELDLLIKELKLSFGELERNYHEMIDKKLKLNTYGLDVNSVRRSYYQNMADNLSMFIEECKDLERNATEFVDILENLNYQYSGGYTFKLSDYNNNYDLSTEGMARDYWNHVIYNLNEFRKDDSSVTKLFKLK